MKLINIKDIKQWSELYNSLTEIVSLKNDKEENEFEEYILDFILINLDEKLKEKDYEIDLYDGYNHAYHISATIEKTSKLLNLNFFNTINDTLKSLGKPHNWIIHLCLEAPLGTFDYDKIANHFGDENGEFQIELKDLKNDDFSIPPESEVKIDVDEIFIKNDTLYVSTTNEVFQAFQKLIKAKP